LFTGSLDRSGQTVSDEDIPELDLNFNGLNLLDDGIEATSQYTCSQEALFLSDEEEDLLPSSKRQRSVETNDSFGSPLNSNPIPVQS
jgi:hypothetical protein